MVNSAVSAFQFKRPERTIFCLLSLGLTFGVQPPLKAQLTDCQGPATGEYLLFVQTPTPDSQLLARRILPSAATTTVCSYQGNTFARIGGFRSAQDADKWGRFVSALTELATAVVEPATATTAMPPSSPVAAYNPQPLGAGYAVLVDYLDRPQIAAQVRQAIGREVGLASYLSRPYLLALYSSDRDSANTTLRQLSALGLSALVVDSTQVILLTPSVRY
ncbi:hypothetical protein [Oscillatoria sp. FACHB-1406]|uniref:hypothetical protein n=1 Tax=Oscillatoria sp. FACHB-1406 TaxID=2692846 RepID=UPI001681E1B5|nr:hypothetical protein [Oscillatoria sp. FACHB-1406]MBD2576806.1 hypothetical protein [Oscillatoria sp. FACHB-1406]